MEPQFWLYEALLTRQQLFAVFLMIDTQLLLQQLPV